MKRIIELVILTDNPIISGHIIQGRPLLPGLAYIDLIYKVANQHLGLSFDEFCLKRLSIFFPLTFSGASKTLLVSVENENDYWKISISDNRNTIPNFPSDEKVYCVAQVHRHAETFDQKIDIKKWKESSYSVLQMEDIYRNARNRNLVHMGLMKAQGNLFLTHQGCLAELSINSIYQNVVGGFTFHPTLLDGAAMAAFSLDEKDSDANASSLFIPIYYDTFSCQTPLTEKCFFAIKIADMHATPDIRKLDIDILNEAGRQIGCIREIRSKRVRNSSSFSNENSLNLPNSKDAVSRRMKKSKSIENSIESHVEVKLKELLSKFLHKNMEDVNWSDSFFDMGFDSAILMSLMLEIESAFCHSFSPTLLFEYGNLIDLKQYIAKTIDNKFLKEETTKSEAQNLLESEKKHYFYANEDFIADHLVYGQAALMGLIYPCVAIRDFQNGAKIESPIEINKLYFQGGPLPAYDSEPIVLTTQRLDDCSYKIHCISQSNDRAIECCHIKHLGASNAIEENISISDMISASRKVPSGEIAKIYSLIDDFYIGDSLRVIEEAFIFDDDDENISISKVKLKNNNVKKARTFEINPIALYISGLSFAELERAHGSTAQEIYVPLMMERIIVFDALPETFYVVNKINVNRNGFRSVDARIYSPEGKLLVDIINSSEKAVSNPDSFTFFKSKKQFDSTQESQNLSDVAVIGLSGRYPGAYEVDQFWENLRDGVDSVIEVPYERWDWREFYSEDTSKAGHHYSKWGGFIDDVDKFDSLFFKISPREAEFMDPQERIFLEHTWIAFEDAGYKISALKNKRIGVYAGVMYSEYQLFGAEASLKGERVGFAKNPAGIANRVSYFFDFSGPSFTLDSMCSSSSTCIHLAVRDLKYLDVDVAVAGGINLSLHSNKYLMLSAGQMLSSRGRCESFGAHGVGYVPAEGVGVVVLKRLKDALQDDDHIYGIIKGSAINHGGKTSGYTVPDPNSQAELISQALINANVDPASISYIEAHGTGTKIGDLIEIKGLIQALGEPADNSERFIGSVKSNIGHCESAAGVAGLTKVLLQFKYGMIVPSLHSKELNPAVELAVNSFRVSQELAPWGRRFENGKVHARRAGLSSFGAGGSNAHIILEEHLESGIDNLTRTHGPVIVVLSARDVVQLREYAKKVVKYLASEKFNRWNVSLDSFAYTLQTGREAFSHRLALIVDNFTEMSDLLLSFISGKSTDGLFYSNLAEGESSVIGELTNTDSLSQKEIVDAWLTGANIDWKQLYRGRAVKKVSLPTYPFERVRHWVDLDTSPIVTEQRDSFVNNINIDREIPIDICFNGDEYFFVDHQFNNNKILPAAFQLGIACNALFSKSDKFQREMIKNFYIFENIAWVRPFIFTETSKSIVFESSHEVSGKWTFLDGQQDNGNQIYSQGELSVGVYVFSDRLVLSEIRGRCVRTHRHKEEFYQELSSRGFYYGENFQAVKELFVGENEVLANIRCCAAKLDQFAFDPVVLDGAFQIVMGLFIELDDAPRQPALPFVVDKCTIHGDLSNIHWAWARKREAVQSQSQTYDILLCDEIGNVFSEIQGFTTRLVNNLVSAKEKSCDEAPTCGAEIPLGLTKFIPRWRPLMEHQLHRGNHNLYSALVFYNQKDAASAKLASELSKIGGRCVDFSAASSKWDFDNGYDHIIWIACSSTTDLDLIIEKQENGLLKLFELCKQIAYQGVGRGEILWTIVTNNVYSLVGDKNLNPTEAALHGLMGALAAEKPNWKVISIDIDITESVSASALLSVLETGLWIYRGGEWYQRQMAPIAEVQLDNELPYKTGGTYIVIGGSGGIGEVWSSWMVKTLQARIIWLGRSELNESLQAKIDNIALLGVRPEYIQCDASDFTSLSRAYKKIQTKHSHINGIIHSALNLLDSSLENMDSNRFRAGLEVKINASVNIARVFAKKEIDFVIFFSSVIAIKPAAGQSNYAAGSAFQDSFAGFLREQWSCPVKVMNWGYWGGVGRVSGDFYRARMDRIGVGSIEAEEGIDALNYLLQSPCMQFACIKTVSSAGAPVLLGSIDTDKAIFARNHFTAMGYEREGIDLLSLPHRDIPQIYEDNNGNTNRMLARILHKCITDLSNLGGQVDARFNKWLECGMYWVEGYSIENTPALEIKSLDEYWEKIQASVSTDKNVSAQTRLLVSCIQNLRDILIGKIKATDIIFPQGSMQLVEGVYKNNNISNYYNDVLTDVLINYIEESISREPLKKVKILEIGAGTGGTTATILERLENLGGAIEEYCYSDCSIAFLHHADRHFVERFSFLTTRVFDVELPLAVQNISHSEFDIVIAANVLHATRDIRQTLANVKATLKKDGLLLINEISDRSLFTHLTFGLLDGWWLYRDDHLRIPGSPGLFPAVWEKLLGEAGFTSVIFPAKEAHELGQQIIGAQSNGITFQPVEAHRIDSSEVIMEKIQPISLVVDQSQAVSFGGFNKELKEKAVIYVKSIVGKVLKIDPAKLSLNLPLDNYGLDSIVIVHLANEFQKVFENITTTLFFEVNSITKLVDYFIANYPQELAGIVGVTQPFTSNNTSINSSASAFSGSTKMMRAVTEKESSTVASIMQQDIAIIGLSGRYPKAANINELWQNLVVGLNCVDEIPKDRWDWQQYYTPERGDQGKIYTKWGGFIDGIDKFDPIFFGIAPRDAKGMDPQERLFLEEAYNCIEDAGYTPGSLSASRKVGVFVGVMNSTYTLQSAHWSIANRVSFVMDFQGPSLAVDTACSSSLTAIHLALQSLYNGSCECAIAGGVNLILRPLHYLGLTAMNMLSSGQECKSFGDAADGFVDAEGVGAMVLKSARDAVADGDHIYGLIKGSAVNSGGKTNGYTVPNPKIQGDLISCALRSSGINARDVSYIEAHGTGTALGDPIEIAGLTQAFKHDTDDNQYCAIGSIKSNIGHCESAAGIAGITKVLLQIKHKKLVSSLHSTTLNSNIDFSKTPFRVNQQYREWIALDPKGRAIPRIAGISSFGAGGANASVFIQEYIPDSVARVEIVEAKIILLSAKSLVSLKRRAEQLLKYIELNAPLITDTLLNDIAFTLQTGREAMEHRLAFVVTTQRELVEVLREYLQDNESQRFFVADIRTHRDSLNLFLDEDDFNFVASLIEQSNYQKLAKIWAFGGNINWLRLPQNNHAHRVSLPTYPFDGERFWLDIDITQKECAQLEEVKASVVKSYDHGAGVYSINFENLSNNSDNNDSVANAIEYNLQMIAEKSEAKVVLLVGSSTSFFTAQGNGLQRVKVVDLLDAIQKFPLPVIAVIRGNCFGLGWLIASVCDLQIIGSKANFSLFPRLDESLYNVEMLQLFLYRYGVSIAKKQFVLQEQVSAEVYSKLVRGADICSDASLGERALELAEDLADLPRKTLGLLKSHLNKQMREHIGVYRKDSSPITEEIIAGLNAHSSNELDAIYTYAAENPVSLIPNEQIDLGYSSVKLFLFPDGIVKIELCETLEKNTFSEAFTSGILAAFSHINASNSYKVVVITGYEQYFACGGTKAGLMAIQQGEAKFTDIDIYALGAKCKVPVIAAMQGHAIGAGWALGMFCDYVVFSTESVFHSPYMRYGFTPGAGATLIFPDRLGFDLGNEILFSAREYKGEDLKSRLPFPVLDREKVMDFALALAAAIAVDSRQEIVAQKKARWEKVISCLAETYSAELAMHEECFVGSNDVRDRIEAYFLEEQGQSLAANLPDAPILSVSSHDKSVHIKSIKETIRIGFATELHMDVTDIDDRKQFIDMGLDSITGVTWIRKINNEYGLSIAATRVYSHPTIDELASYIYGECEKLGKFSLKQNDKAVRPLKKNKPLFNSLLTTKELVGGTQIEANLLQGSGSSKERFDPIAVIGMAGQFPKANNIEQYWENIIQGRDCISEIPAERWSIDEFFDADPEAPGKTHCKWIGALDHVGFFDPLFFNISPLEAKGMDPQQRLFLQSAWHCFEDAACSPEQLSGSLCGVFVGCAASDYGHLLGGEALSAQGMVGGSTSILAARISYMLNLQGPCLSIDTACSSSLVAIASACDSLILGNSDIALAGGVCVMAGPGMHIMASKAGMLSSDGRCFSFDERANGFVPGEGVGVLLLKRLADAERDCDRIQGVIRGWGVNQDGKTNGITAPNPRSQAQLEKSVYKRFNINPNSIQLIEAHGTGTSLGDPIEIEALKEAFSAFTSHQNFCAIGSVKSNIGHLLPAAGVAGSIKALLSLQHRQLPPTINYHKLNSHIELDDSPFYVNTSAKEWSAIDELPRRAAVSAFGFSGTNAHLVFEEYCDKNTDSDYVISVETSASYLIPLSAKSMERLAAYASALMDFCQQSGFRRTQDVIQDLAYTLQIGRAPMDFRLCLIVTSLDDLFNKLQLFINNKKDTGIYQAQVKRNNSTIAMFDSDEDLQQVSRQWILKNKWEKIADLWSQGLNINWMELYKGARRKKLRAPLYPFLRDLYWVESLQAKKTPSELDAYVHPDASDSSKSQARVTTQHIKQALQVPVQNLPVYSPVISERKIPQLKLDNILLDPPQSYIGNKAEQNVSKPNIGLVDISILPTQALDCKSYYQIFTGYNGIYSIQITNVAALSFEPANYIAVLEEAFSILKQQVDIKVLIIEEIDFSVFDLSRLTQNELNSFLRLPLEFPTPIVYLTKQSLTGLSCLLALMADFLIGCEDVHFGCATVPQAQMLLRLLSLRLPLDLARLVVQQDAGISAQQLGKTGAGIFGGIAADAEMLSLEFAARLSEMPRTSLALLKQTMAASLLDALAECATSPMTNSLVASPVILFENHCKELLMKGEIVECPDLAVSIDIDSEVVSVSAYNNGVVLIALHDRKHKNTFSLELIEGIQKAFLHIKDQYSYRVVVLTGFDQYFACGGTKEGLIAIQEGEIKFTDINIYTLAIDCELPVIAAMQGHGIGAGWSMGMFADCVLYSEESVYLSPYMQYGFTPGAGSTLIFPERFGLGFAREILFCAREFQGRDIKARNCNSIVLPRVEVLKEALRLASYFATKDRLELIEEKNRRVADLRRQLTDIFDREVKMHETSFVGNEEVLLRIQNEFNSGLNGIAQEEMMLDEKAECIEAPAVANTDIALTDMLEDAEEAVISEVRHFLRSSFAEELHLQSTQIDNEIPFVEMGLDSITGVTWVRKINKEFGLSIPTTKVYNHPTIEAFAEYIYAVIKKSNTSVRIKKDVPNNSTDVCLNVRSEVKSCQALPLKNKSVLHEEEPQIACVNRNIQQAQNEIMQQAIAVIGMAGQFPCARNIDEFWSNLIEKRDCVEGVPATRWSLEEYYDPDPNARGKTHCRWMGVLQDADKFDPRFFNISPREALWMDPQQRLFLECAWQSVEDAGYNPKSLSGSRCGVFVGCATGDYGSMSCADDSSAQGFTGGATAILAGRISYVMNLQGPSISIDTACSASLVAIASACDSLILGNSDLALAGGVCVMAGPGMHIMTSKTGMLSKDGRCYSFDQRANGFVPGEGVGVVVLKRLDDAIENADNIQGVIKGWGVNQDGRTNGITAPNQDAQTRLLKEIYQRFNINPANIQMIEAHGTGTQLGDPIEIEGLKQAFNEVEFKRPYCALGSVKSNVGHLLTAAGVASTIKVLLSLRYQQIPATINFENINENIDLETSPFYINKDTTEWRVSEGEKRCAAISSFGFSGTNAHLVIEEYQSPVTITTDVDSPKAIILSAKTFEALKCYAEKLLAYSNLRSTQVDLHRLAYTLQVGRNSEEFRLGFVIDNKQQLKEKLECFLNGAIDKGLYVTQIEHLSSKSGNDRETVEKAIKNGDLDTLVMHWTQGREVSWQTLYAAEKIRRVSAPTYPFVRDSFWHDGKRKREKNDEVEMMCGTHTLEGMLDAVLNETLGVHDAALALLASEF